MPDFFDVLHTQRAARTFLPDDVDDETVARVLTAATHAPTAENSQPFVFVVVRDPDLRATIGALTARIWQGGARAYEEERLSATFLADVDRGAMGGIAAAPVLIVVCGDTRLTLKAALPSSIFPAVQNLLLAAHALGLGSTLTTLPVVGGDELSGPLELPPEVVPARGGSPRPPPQAARPAPPPADLGKGAPGPLRHPVPVVAPPLPLPGALAASPASAYAELLARPDQLHMRKVCAFAPPNAQQLAIYGCARRPISMAYTLPAAAPGSGAGGRSGP